MIPKLMTAKVGDYFWVGTGLNPKSAIVRITDGSRTMVSVGATRYYRDTGRRVGAGALGPFQIRDAATTKEILQWEKDKVAAQAKSEDQAREAQLRESLRIELSKGFPLRFTVYVDYADNVKSGRFDLTIRNLSVEELKNIRDVLTREC